MRRIRIAVASAILGAAVVGGISAASVQHDAHCAALHARAAAYQDAANKTSDPTLKAQYQRRADNLEAKADRCDARGTTTVPGSTSTT